MVLGEARQILQGFPGPCFGQAGLRDGVRSSLAEWLGEGDGFEAVFSEF